MQITTDCIRQELRIPLGETVLPVTDYQLKTEVPVRRLTLCSGTPYTRLLGELPCTLTVSSTLLRSDASDIVSALQYAMRTHTEFSFSFAGMTFYGMTPIAASCSVKQEEKQSLLSVTLLGVIKA